jgi:TPR repeat protein
MNSRNFSARLTSVVTIGLALGCYCYQTHAQEAAGRQSSPSARDDAVSTGQEHLLLEPDELRRLQTEALGGKSDAAARVAMHFAEKSIAGQRYREEARYWFEIGAENGDIEAMLSHAQLTYEAGGWRNCRRALYWLTRVHAQAPNDEVRASAKIWRQKIIADQNTCAAQVPNLPAK